MKHSSKGFTLVELIVVVIILGILASIGFVSYSEYLTGTRDSNRLSQLANINESLSIYGTEKDLPLPADYVTIAANGTTVAYQGYAGADVLDLIAYNNGGRDPLDNQYFTYYVTSDRSKFQLLSYMEEGESLQTHIPFINSTYAATDYTLRFPKVYGKKLGILTEALTKDPIQEVSSLVTAGTLDIGTSTGSYTAHFSDSSTLSGTGGTLVSSIPNANCKRIKQTGESDGDGIYTINPTGASEIQVYCDMTTDGGGWTFFGYIDGGSAPVTFAFDAAVGTYKPSRSGGSMFSIDASALNHTETMVTLDSADPATAASNNKIIFFTYESGHSSFNTGPTPCTGLDSTGYTYKLSANGTYATPSSSTTYCTASSWYTYNGSTDTYMLLTADGSAGNYWGVGMGGDNSWGHNGWWYVR